MLCKELYDSVFLCIQIMYPLKKTLNCQIRQQLHIVLKLTPPFTPPFSCRKYHDKAKKDGTPNIQKSLPRPRPLVLKGTLLTSSDGELNLKYPNIGCFLMQLVDSVGKKLGLLLRLIPDSVLHFVGQWKD